MFNAIGEHTQCEGLSRRHGFLFCGTVGQYARHIYDFGNPASVRLKFRFDPVYDVRHTGILSRSLLRGGKVWMDFLLSGKSSARAKLGPTVICPGD